MNYVIADGSVYCLAGYGHRSHWAKNLKGDPQAELLLPGGAVTCQAEVVEEPEEKMRMLRNVMVNSGLLPLSLEASTRSGSATADCAN